jgi:hypothetical protein
MSKPIMKLPARPRPDKGPRTRVQRDPKTGSTPRVYLASPIQTYDSPRYERMVAMVAARFPGAEILEARALYRSHQDWLDRWPVILPTLTALAFFSDDDGYIGAGVSREIDDASAQGIDVWALTDRGVFCPMSRVMLGERDDLNWRRHIRVTYRPTRAG